MKLSIEKDRKINKLIPKLLIENKDYSKEIKTRLKISSIFNEFEKKAQNEFNFYINDSNKRYTKAKNGQNIDNYIEKSQQKYEDRYSKIMNDKFYTELNLKPEKEKMKHKSTKKLYTNIKDLLTNIKITIGSSKLRKNSIFNYNNLYNNNNQKKLNRIYKNNKYNKCNTENELSLNNLKTIETIDDKKLFENKNEIKNIFNLDCVKLSNSIDNYKIKLSKIKIPFIKDIKEQNQDNKKISINLPQIKLLYYHKYRPPIKNDDSNLEKVDINKLLPFSKFGRHLPKQRSENKVIKSQDIPSFMTETINKKWNYGSTNDITMNAAKNNIRLKNNYSFKRSKIKELLENKIPKVEEYEYILKQKGQNIKDKRHNINKEINKKQKFKFLTKRQLLNFNLDKNIEFLKEKEQKYDE